MQYENCNAAIQKLQQKKDESNVHTNKSDVTCPITPSPCDWVGNTMQYACLLKEYKHPAKVYTQLNSGAFGTIRSTHT